MADFIVRALLAGLCVAAVAGPLGCFVVWRRMAYFGDTLAHSALLGIALGLILEVNLQLAVVTASCLLALLLGLMERQQRLATDTLLGILAHSALAFGLVVISFSQVPVDLMAYLFGDLLTVSSSELAWIAGCAALVLAGLALIWNPLLSITLHEELARVDGLAVERYRLCLLVLVALLVAISMKVVGVLLITALLIIPPACARGLSRSPESMALLASVVGAVAVIGGMAASFFWNTPTGPSIVVCAALLFVISQLFTARKTWRAS